VLHERRIDIVSSLEPTKLQRDGLPPPSSGNVSHANNRNCGRAPVRLPRSISRSVASQAGHLRFGVNIAIGYDGFSLQDRQVKLLWFSKFRESHCMPAKDYLGSVSAL